MVTTIVLALAGCSSGSADSSSTSTSHNEADVTFATDMIPHHSQAVTMAEMATARSTDHDVVRLASRIKAEQDPEIATLSGWLTDWGQPVPTADAASMAAGMSGMMSENQMARLGRASGRHFDMLWLEMMVEHHQGAVEMAQREQDDGENEAAKELAATIVAAQRAEITTMERMLTE